MDLILLNKTYNQEHLSIFKMNFTLIKIYLTFLQKILFKIQYLTTMIIATILLKILMALTGILINISYKIIKIIKKIFLKTYNIKIKYKNNM